MVVAAQISVFLTASSSASRKAYDYSDRVFITRTALSPSFAAAIDCAQKSANQNKSGHSCDLERRSIDERSSSVAFLPEWSLGLTSMPYDRLMNFGGLGSYQNNSFKKWLHALLLEAEPQETFGKELEPAMYPCGTKGDANFVILRRLMLRDSLHALRRLPRRVSREQAAYSASPSLRSSGILDKTSH